MKELDPLCKAISEKKIKSIQKCIDLHQEDLAIAKELYGWREVTIYINKNASANLKETFLTNMFYRSLKKNKDSALKTVKGTLKENTIAEKKPSTISFEKGNNTDIDLSGFKNLNRLSLKLISDHGLTLSDLEEIGISGIGDDMAVYEKIDRFCEKLKVKSKRERYSNL